MGLLEIFAAATTVLSVVLTVRRSLWQFPAGILATGLYLVVFTHARLYGSAALQIAFVAVQVYGWWFWLRGDRGGRPPIRSWPLRPTAVVIGIATIVGSIAGFALYRWTDAQSPLADAGIFALSLAAQFLLDRKVLQHWPIWAVVNILSIGVYASQGLWPTTSLYVVLLANVGVGWWAWRRVMARAEPTR